MKEQIAVIGIEMHCELKSNSKVFSNSPNIYSEIANVNITPLDIALPGTLPVVNKKCVKDAIKMALILNCDIASDMYFDRKNYYYPDLPKGYQITQFDRPVGINGNIKIEVGDTLKEVLIHDIHLEEDTANLDHYFDTSLIDYNRAGVPLLELVTEPIFNSADEVLAFLHHMISIYRYTGISDADTKKGEIRCDVNVSIMDKDSKEYGTKVEVKGVNSLSGIYDTINYEIKRQTELKRSGKYNEVVQETRRWDEESGTTIRMRSKEDAIDYKYFVDPNIPRYKITDEWIESIKKEIPRLGLERKYDYIKTFGLSNYDASVLVKDKDISDYFEEMLKLEVDPKIASNWITTMVLGYINKYQISIKEIYMTPKRLKDLIEAINKDIISNKQAKEIFFKVIDEKKEVSSYLTNNTQINDKETIIDIIDKILELNPKQIEAYKNGKTNLFDFFVGQVMKETKGKANPVITKEVLTEKFK